MFCSEKKTKIMHYRTASSIARYDSCCVYADVMATFVDNIANKIIILFIFSLLSSCSIMW